MISNEYQIISDRQSYSQSLVLQGTNENKNMGVNSHRKIAENGSGVLKKHMRHNSDQMQVGVDMERS